MARKYAAALITIIFLSTALFATPGDILTSFSLPGQCPTGLAYDGEHLWVADRLNDSLYALNPETGEVVQSMPSPGFIPRGLAWDGEMLWMVDGEEGRILRIDTESGLTVKSIEAPTPRPRGLAWDGENLWLADDRTEQLVQFSTDDGTTIRAIPAPAGHSTGLAWDGAYLWCADRILDRIYMIEPEHGMVIVTLDAPGLYAQGLAWMDDYLCNVDYQSDSLYTMIIRDETQYRVLDSNRLDLQFTHEFRNYGPGEIESLDVFFALPEERETQTLLTQPVFTPEPMNYVEDRWGQRCAHWEMAGLELAARNRITMDITAELHQVRWYIFPEMVGELKDIPDDILTLYTADEDKYRILDPVIQQAVAESVGDEENPYWIMRKIHKYVGSQLYYELSGGWNVAPAVLTRGNGSCSEYTFVFIAMCRAAGLPARYVGSVVVRGDDASSDDVFHRWCEVYLPGYGWIPVDPQAGDKESPAESAASIGELDARFLITTQGGGASEYLEWGYNTNEQWTSRGPVKIHVESVGEWSPAAEMDEGTED